MYCLWSLKVYFPASVFASFLLSGSVVSHTAYFLSSPSSYTVDSLSGPCFLCQGLFVQLVQANSPSALAGLRFGDQVLQINGQNCAGWSTDKAHKALKAAAETRIELVVRDRWGATDAHYSDRASYNVCPPWKLVSVWGCAKENNACVNIKDYLCRRLCLLNDLLLLLSHPIGQTWKQLTTTDSYTQTWALPICTNLDVRICISISLCLVIGLVLSEAWWHILCSWTIWRPLLAVPITLLL